MVDNFNLRQFLTENKLTKNAQLLKEVSDYGFDNLMDEVDARYQEGTPEHTQLSLAVEKALNSGEIDTAYFADEPSSVARVVDAIEDEISTQSMEEEVNEAKEYSFIFNYNTDEDDVEYIQKVLDRAGADAIAKAGIDSEEMIVKAFNAMGLRKAKQAIEADGFEISDEINEASYKTVKKPKETVEENTMTQRDKYLTRLVENALGLDPDEMEDYPEGEELQNRIDRNIDQAMYRGEAEREVGLGEGEEMVNEKPMPKYENIEKLMQEIDKNTDEEAHKFKVQEMKRVADMLEKKCTALEEGDDADHIDQKKLKQMKKDIMTLRKGIEKMEKLGNKKFTKKETKAELKEGFDLRNFLVENKLTSNSRLQE